MTDEQRLVRGRLAVMELSGREPSGQRERLVSTPWWGPVWLEPRELGRERRRVPGRL